METSATKFCNSALKYDILCEDKGQTSLKEVTIEYCYLIVTGNSDVACLGEESCLTVAFAEQKYPMMPVFAEVAGIRLMICLEGRVLARVRLFFLIPAYPAFWTRDNLPRRACQ